MRSSVVEPGRAPREAGPDKNMDYSSQPYIPQNQPVPPLPKNARRAHERRLLLISPEEGWLALLFLAIALYCVVFSIIAAKWVNQSQTLLFTPVVGLLVGLCIAKIPKLPQAILHLAACLLGYWFSVLLTSLVAFHTSWVVLLAGLRSTLTGNIASLSSSVSMMVFFFYLAFLCFFLGYFGSWLVYRARLAWLVALVYCSIMLVNLNYLNVNDNHRYLMVVMLGALLLLVARLNLVSQISAWKMEGLHTDRAWMHSITLRFMRVATIITLIVMVFSIILPAQQQTTSGKAIWNQLNGVWNSVAGGRLSALNPGSLSSSGTPSTNFFSDQLTISGNVHLPTGEVLYYSSDISHYLQSFAYNSFDGHTWKIAPVSLQNQFYAAGQILPSQDADAPYNRIGTKVTIELPPGGTKNYIFAPSQPVDFDVDTQLYSLGGIANAWTQSTPLEKGKSYTVVSNVLAASPESLQQVPLPRANMSTWNEDQDYHQIASLDLQLPNDLSPTVYTLARQWTQGSTDTYTALRDLESHLSDTNVFTYSIDNPPIPANQDVVDYLLKNKRGYCTYYATAMVMMARILNIPTRMMNGFSRGHYDLQRKVWLVDGSDAHSWVQAYFPGYGWVDFDPTPGYSLHASSITPNPTPQPTVRPLPSPSAVATPPTQATPPVTKAEPNTSSQQHTGAPLNSFNEMILIWLSVLILLCSFFVFLAALLARWWRNLYANSTFVTGTFWRFCRIASWVGLAPKGWQTPYEYSRMLRQQLPQGSMPFQHLTELFVRDRWGPPQAAPRPQEEAHIQQCWPALRTELLLRVFRRRKK
ncbi:MAG TPA: transglutaminase domain-containing protein [Ktedonobacteraceae bacterium]|jgi:transglutaminase-like putative cysteine protease|nr:transglutaminase domain-containing protein [Ktedonobacteraceae bacterium]